MYGETVKLKKFITIMKTTTFSRNPAAETCSSRKIMHGMNNTKTKINVNILCRLAAGMQ